MLAARGLLGLAVIFCALAGGVGAVMLLGMVMGAAQSFPEAVSGATATGADYLMARVGVFPALVLILGTVAATAGIAFGRRMPVSMWKSLAVAILCAESFGLATAGLPGIVAYRMSPEAARSPDVWASHAMACRKDFQDPQDGPVGARNGYRLMECKPVLPQRAVDRYCGEAASRGAAFRDGNEQVACHAEAAAFAGHALAGPLSDERVAEVERGWAGERRWRYAF